MARIYVSSTYLDLQEYRAQVEKVIRRMGHTDVAMEYYVAEDTRPVKKCLDDVASCDIYVGIYAWRYGWQPTDDNPDKLSVTEMEFRQAEKFGKPCFIFLLSDDAPWPRKHIDKDASKIENFRNTASAKHTADYFATPDELARKVAEAIYKQIPAAVSIPEHNIGTYFEALRKRYNVLALEGLTPPQKKEYLQIQLRSVYVEQSVREDAPPVELPKEVWEKLSREQEIHDEDLPSGITLEDVRKARESYYQKPSQLVLDALIDSKNKYAIVLGDPGSGKSTLARYIMLSLIDPALAGDKIQKAFEGYLPLLIELRTFAGLCADNKCETPLEFLEHLGKTEGWGLTQSALQSHLKGDGRAVVIFDGLDEIFEPKLRETITNQIVGFTNAYPKARVIVTSRILGYRRKILSDAGFTHFTLQDLNEGQVRAFITQWYDLAMSDRPDEAKERRERILKSFADQASIRQLAGNPMLLTIMAIIGKHQELPRERWKLYDHAASVLIQHWDVNKHLKDERIEADFIGEDDKKELLRRLAFRMQSGDGGLAGNYMHREALQEEFETYLKERYSQTPDRAKVIAEKMIQQFRERNFILSLYGANVFGFVHRAFLEYFCASAFVWKFEKTKELTIEQLKSDVYGKHWEDQSWHEVLRLICGMINEKWAGDIAESLLNFEYKGKKPDTKLEIEIKELLKKHPEVRVHLRRRSMWFSTDILYEISNPNLLYKTILKFMCHENGLVRDDILIFLLKLPNRILETLSLLLERAVQDEDEGVRYAAVSVLAKHYHDDLQTLLLLRERAVQDKDANVRRAAVSALIEHYHKDAETLPLLRERAVKDENANVRSAAVWMLAEHYREDAATLPLVRERAVQDDDSDVRHAAVSALAEHYRADAKTLILLRERAVQDNNANVRRAAVSALAEHYREDAATLPLLRERAVNDESPKQDDHEYGQYVRETVINAIAKYWSDHPDTLGLLRERAEHDPTPWLRERCQELVKEIEGKRK